VRGDGGEHHERPEAEKRDLILGLQVLLRGVLRIAAGLEHGPDLVKISLSGHEQYAVWREGTHDDLVFAVALECAECVPEGPSGRGAVVDEPAPGGRGADVSKEEGMNRTLRVQLRRWFHAKLAGDRGPPVMAGCAVR
jgi:hypothetical protein